MSMYRAIFIVVGLLCLGLAACTNDGNNQAPTASFDIQLTQEGDANLGEFQGVITVGILPPNEDFIDLRLDASASSDSDGDTLSYQWDLGDGNQAEGEVVVHTFARITDAQTVEEGRIRVRLTVSDGQGGSDTMQKAISIINEVPPP